MTERTKNPVAVYFETSILRQLPRTLSNPEFIQLKKLCDDQEIKMFIPKVALDELVSDYQQLILKQIDIMEKQLTNMAVFVGSKPSISWPSNSKLSSEKIEKYFKEKVTELELEVIQTPTPKISLDLLLDMSIKKTRPFEEKGEKGFRDSVILFTVLEKAKQLEKGFHLLIANDAVFQHNDIYAKAHSENVDLLVLSSISDSITEINKYLKSERRRYYETEENRLKEFLNQYRDEIMTYIREQEQFSSYFLAGDDLFGSNIKKIKEISFVKFVKVTAGFLPQGTTKGKVKISFTIELKFALIEEIVPSPPRRMLSLTSATPISETQEEILSRYLKSMTLSPTDFKSIMKSIFIRDLPEHSEEREREVNRDVSIEASVFRENNDYSNLTIERIVVPLF